MAWLSSSARACAGAAPLARPAWAGCDKEDSRSNPRNNALTFDWEDCAMPRFEKIFGS